jgi:hypothetical protein
MVHQNLGPILAGMRLLFADPVKSQSALWSQMKEPIVPRDRLCSPVSGEGRATCA